MKTIDGASMKDFYSKFDELTDIFMGHSMEDRELGHGLFERDRQELLDSTITFMKGRFDSPLPHDILRWMRDSSWSTGVGHQKTTPPLPIGVQMH